MEYVTAAEALIKSLPSRRRSTPSQARQPRTALPTCAHMPDCPCSTQLIHASWNNRILGIIEIGF